MYHSLRSTEDNEILRLLDEDPECQIVIATIAFANGLNVKALLDSISLGIPDTVDQLVQEKGRVGRDSETAARGVVLFQPSTLAAAQKQLEGAFINSTLTKGGKPKRQKKKPKPLEHAKVLLLTEQQCYIAAFNRIYKNPPLEATTLDCIGANRRLPCSLCATRNNIRLAFPTPALPRGIELPLFIHSEPLAQSISAADKILKLSKPEREQAEAALVKFGATVHRTERKLAAHRNRPKSSYFPTSLIRSILDKLLALDSLNKLETILNPWVFAMTYRVRLYALVHELRTTITSQREAARLEKNAKQRTTRRKKKGIYESESEDEEEDMDDLSSSDEEIDEHARSSPIPPPPKRTRRVLEEVTNNERTARTHEESAKATSTTCRRS
ncbi:hypothetical protein B0H13DRAFT_2384850 [Mycena leptocephala]|nr:hypothetical protein B0H13DRAFT_2384850 [Mycena leptocephala]